MTQNYINKAVKEFHKELKIWEDGDEVTIIPMFMRVLEKVVADTVKGVATDIEEKMQPAFDDFTNTGQFMIGTGEFKKSGTEMIENVGYMKSVLKDLTK